MEQIKKINVAPSSDEGHFIEKAEKVMCLDDVNETFKVKGPSVLTTKNHTSLRNEEDCLVTCQVVYDPFAKVFEKSRD